MSSQKNDKTIEQHQKLYSEDKKYPWILGNPKRTLRTESLGTSTAIYMDIQQKNVEDKRKKKIPESITIVNEQSI